MPFAALCCVCNLAKSIQPDGAHLPLRHRAERHAPPFVGVVPLDGVHDDTGRRVRVFSVAFGAASRPGARWTGYKYMKFEN